MDDDFTVVVGAGSYQSEADGVLQMPHRWTSGGVSVEALFTGAHLLHLAVAGCVLNDLYREAEALDIQLGGVRVRTTGRFDTRTWRSTGIEYSVELASAASDEDLARLLDAVDGVAEIPRALRVGTIVTRVEP